ncbi:MAG: hypoxanthine phosphoribosyltransferase [Candidatus Hydrogenedentota bacterium]|nr:MAG: hypoxanthine phosphoribosyltransferase [Candidatus Hydrogenedentota bacterium]
MKNERLQVLLSRDQISERVKELAEAISRDYADRNLLILCVLKGAVIFLADLVRNLKVTPELDFIAASSYQRDNSKGKVDVSPMFSASVGGKDVLIVEDIIDTGLTYRALINYLAVREPASLKLCTLLDKPSQRRTELIKPNYVGFTIPDKFVVGYGLDYEEKYRELPDICILVT